MSAHTPTPWHIGMKPGPMIYGQKGEQIADMTGQLLMREETRANAAFIVRACNCHDQLMGALQTIQKILGEALPVDYKRDCFAALKVADVALSNLAKARGEL